MAAGDYEVRVYPTAETTPSHIISASFKIMNDNAGFVEKPNASTNYSDSPAHTESNPFKAEVIVSPVDISALEGSRIQVLQSAIQPFCGSCCKGSQKESEEKAANEFFELCGGPLCERCMQQKKFNGSLDYCNSAYQNKLKLEYVCDTISEKSE